MNAFGVAPCKCSCVFLCHKHVARQVAEKIVPFHHTLHVISTSCHSSHPCHMCMILFLMTIEVYKPTKLSLVKGHLTASCTTTDNKILLHNATKKTNFNVCVVVKKEMSKKYWLLLLFPCTVWSMALWEELTLLMLWLLRSEACFERTGWAPWEGLCWLGNGRGFGIWVTVARRHPCEAQWTGCGERNLQVIRKCTPGCTDEHCNHVTKMVYY